MKGNTEPSNDLVRNLAVPVRQLRGQGVAAVHKASLVPLTSKSPVNQHVVT